MFLLLFPATSVCSLRSGEVIGMDATEQGSWCQPGPEVEVPGEVIAEDGAQSPCSPSQHLCAKVVVDLTEDSPSRAGSPPFHTLERLQPR